MMHDPNMADALAEDHEAITRPAPRRITLFPDHAHDLGERRRADDTLSPWAEKRGDWNEELVPEGRKGWDAMLPLTLFAVALTALSAELQYGWVSSVVRWMGL